MKSTTIETAIPTEDRYFPATPNKAGANIPAASQMPFCRKHLTTDEAADLLCVQPQTLRKALSQRGSYGGVIPRKGAFNRLLYWDADAVRRLVEGA